MVLPFFYQISMLEGLIMGEKVKMRDVKSFEESKIALKVGWTLLDHLNKSNIKPKQYCAEKCSNQVKFLQFQGLYMFGTVIHVIQNSLFTPIHKCKTQ